MKKAIIHIVTLTFLFASISCGTPVSEYEPKNQAEQEIKAVLIDEHVVGCVRGVAWRLGFFVLFIATRRETSAGTLR